MNWWTNYNLEKYPLRKYRWGWDEFWSERESWIIAHINWMPKNSESTFSQKKKKNTGSRLKWISKEYLEMEKKSLSYRFCPLIAIKEFPSLCSFKNNPGIDYIMSQCIRRQGWMQSRGCWRGKSLTFPDLKDKSQKF